MAAAVDLRIEQGTSWGIAFPVLDEAGDPVDITGWTARAQIRPRATSPVVYFEWSSTGSAPGLMVVDGESLALIVTAEQSSAWDFQLGVWDAELTTPSGDRWRPAGGRVFVSREVTR